MFLVKNQNNTSSSSGFFSLLNLFLTKSGKHCTKHIWTHVCLILPTTGAKKVRLRLQRRVGRAAPEGGCRFEACTQSVWPQTGDTAAGLRGLTRGKPLRKQQYLIEGKGLLGRGNTWVVVVAEEVNILRRK